VSKEAIRGGLCHGNISSGEMGRTWTFCASYRCKCQELACVETKVRVVTGRSYGQNATTRQVRCGLY
jgi:hypothetical protein